MTVVTFVRHAQSDWSVRDELRRPLTQSGLREARRLAAVFDHHRVDSIYCSPCARALQTLEPLAERRGISISVMEELRERTIGQYVEDFAAFAGRQWTDFTFKLDGGESLGEVRERYLRALFLLLEKERGTSIVIGTHGTALSVTLNHFDPSFGYERFLSIAEIMPYLIELTFEGTEFLSVRRVPTE